MSRQLFLLAMKRYLPFFFVIVLLSGFVAISSPLSYLQPLLWLLLAVPLFLLPLSQRGGLPSIKATVLYLGQFIVNIIVITRLGKIGEPLLVALFLGASYLLLYTQRWRYDAERWMIFISLSTSIIAVFLIQRYPLSYLNDYVMTLSIGFVMAVSIIMLRHLMYVTELSWQLYFYVDALEKVLLKLFDCYLNPDYPNERYLYEKRIHDAKNTVILLSSEIDALINTVRVAKADALHPFIHYKKQCDDVFLLLIKSGQLRHRIHDHATFRFCADEMQQIKHYLCDELAKLQRSVLAKSTHLVQDDITPIDNIEGIYELVLQVVASEPISFLLFIQDVKQISKRIVNIG